MTEIDKEEFESWRDLPITRWVLQAIQLQAIDTRENAIARFFHGGDVNLTDLAYERGVFDGLSFATPNELDYDRLVDIHTNADPGDIINHMPTAWGTPQ